MNKEFISLYEKLHDYYTCNREHLRKDKICGCFFCGSIFTPDKIVDWIIDKQGDTARCPFCGADTVIGESCGYEINKEFLSQISYRDFDKITEN